MAFVKLYSLFLRNKGLSVTAAYSAAEALELLKKAPPDVVVLDVMMEHFDSGFNVSRLIKEKHPTLPVILMTAIGEETGLDFSPKDEEERSCSTPTPSSTRGRARSSFSRRSTNSRARRRAEGNIGGRGRGREEEDPHHRRQRGFREDEHARARGGGVRGRGRVQCRGGVHQGRVRPAGRDRARPHDGAPRFRIHARQESSRRIRSIAGSPSSC